MINRLPRSSVVIIQRAGKRVDGVGAMGTTYIYIGGYFLYRGGGSQGEMSGGDVLGTSGRCTTTPISH